MNNQTITIDIVSDIVCPWCYIGQERLRKALAELPEMNFEVSWRPFQLNPDVPAGGIDRQAYMKQKFGARTEEMTAHVTNIAHEEGLSMDFNKASKIPNTIQAHRLMGYAQEEGKDSELAYLLFKAYFADGGDVESKEALVEKGREAGVSEASLRHFLVTNDGEEAVRYEEHQYRSSGITSVPSFIINNKYLVQGAQPPEMIRGMLQDLANREEAHEHGHSCGHEGCNHDH